MEAKINNEGDQSNKIDEVMLPGFRFHPTDEELVGFYLKRKIQERHLSIELIKQLDIYKFDPWDLPKFASTGEKEWYFFCPRDRKYRNSARPNRVTGAGFWKATGTDRPIYSSEGNKCIGLKKSLVFYKGRAAKGVKTDWMMHEFRLPSLGDSIPSKRCLDRSYPANDSWAICRIFKKSSPITPRTVSNSWVSPTLQGSTNQFTPKNTQLEKITNYSSPIQVNSNNINNELNNIILQSTNTTFSYLDHQFPNIAAMLDIPPSYILPQLEDSSDQVKSNVDISSMLSDLSSEQGFVNKSGENGNMEFGGFNGQHCCHDLSSFTLSQIDVQNNLSVGGLDDDTIIGNDFQELESALMGNLNNLLQVEDERWRWDESSRYIGSFPMAGLLPSATLSEAWKSSGSSLLWDCAPLS